jgi:hypothetical protein
MTCVICRTSFNSTCWSSPFDPCECGACLSPRYARELQEDDPQAFADLVAAWEQERQAGQAALKKWRAEEAAKAAKAAAATTT